MTEVRTSFAAIWIQPEQDSRGRKRFGAKPEELYEVLSRVPLLLSYGDVGFAVGSPAYSFRRQRASAKQTTAKADQAKKYVWPTDPSLYVGSDTCQTCHEEIYTHFATTAHFTTTMDAKLDAHKGAEWHGCEACHGPGKEHVDGGGDKSKIFTFKDATPQQTSARCLRCHQYTEEHGNYDRSMHLANGVACIDCHSPHKAKESQFLMKAKSPELCFTCHMSVRARICATLSSPRE